MTAQYQAQVAISSNKERALDDRATGASALTIRLSAPVYTSVGTLHHPADLT